MVDHSEMPINSIFILIIMKVFQSNSISFFIQLSYLKSFLNVKIERLPKDIREIYKTKLIPDAVGYWENSLKVKNAYSPIYLGQSCETSQVYYSEKTKTVSCETSCSPETMCGDYIAIPKEHLDICRYCLNGDDCRESGRKYSGINADFVLYISAIETPHCNVQSTVAFASYCQLESKYNRY
jgi:hypothetical protein